MRKCIVRLDPTVLRELSTALDAWKGMIASGYECPAASKPMGESAQLLATIADMLSSGKITFAHERDDDIVERVAKALFVHGEGFPVSHDTLDYWFSCDVNSTGEDAHCKDTCDWLRGQARAAIDAIETLHEEQKSEIERLRAAHIESEKQIAELHNRIVMNEANRDV